MCDLDCGERALEAVGCDENHVGIIHDIADQATADTYLLTDEQLEFREVVRQIAQERVAPRAAEIDEKAEYPYDLRKLLAEQDILGLPFDAEHGGTGTGTLTLNIAVEELAKACASTALILMVQELGSLPIKLFGSDELKQKYLPRLASGEWTPAFALSEVEAGSDPGGMRTRAVRDGDDWILDGEKNWITNLGVADLFVVFAVTNPDEGHSRGISAFVVERDWPGVEIGKLEHKMGIRGSPTGQPVFTDVRVPAENLIGEANAGFKVAMATLDRSRLGVAAQGLGLAQGATDFAAAYAKERRQFGKPIIAFQGIQFKLADMETQCAAARELLYKACAKVDRLEADMGKYSAMAKLFCSDTAMAVTTEAVQVLGGYGYVKEYPVERMMRDAKITQIYEGTNEIQRVVIARAMRG
ncbi:MAG TPA: acyl-CoA dehydrogenase family protein [Thermoleophilaceae bacterium]